MKYYEYSCSPDLHPGTWFFFYLVTSPFTYYAIDNKNTLGFLLLVLLGGTFIYLLYKEVMKKISSMTFIFEKCKADNEDYKKRLDQANSFIENSEISDINKLKLTEILCSLKSE